MSDEVERYSKAFISYIDDKGIEKDGLFDNVIVGPNTVSFDTSKNRLILPWSRIKKVKTDKGVHDGN